MKRLVEAAHKIYEEMKENHAKQMGLLGIPNEFRSHLVCVGGASEQARLTRRFLHERQAKRVLVVGVSGGRDFWYIKERDFAVDGFDLVQPAGFPSIYVGNVEDPETLPQGPYDAIVFGEVVEHLRDDAAALRNLRDLLCPEGTLILTVPFFNDKPDYHLHIYSPVTIRRLLAACGFKISAQHYRPGPFPLALWPVFNYFLHTLNAIFYLLTGRTIYHRLLPNLWAIYDYMSQWEVLNRFSGGFGVTIGAVRVEEATDYIELNRSAFWDHN